MFNFFKKASHALILMSLILGLGSCGDDKNNTNEPEPEESSYAIWLQLGSWPNTFQYVVGTPSLSTGSVNLKGNGVEVTGKADYGIIPHQGFYYYPSTSSGKGRLSKFSLENNQLTTVLEVPYTHIANINSYIWADDNTLIFLGTDGDSKKILYSVVDAKTLKVTNGEIKAPAIPQGFLNYALGNVNFVGGKLFLGLAHTAQWPAPAEKKVSVLVVDYPSFNYVKTITDTRTVGPGVSNMWSPGSFSDEKGDIYYLANPSWMGTGLPSAIYRIKSGTTEFDASYFFNTNTSSIGNPAESIWYLGNGQAIVKYLDQSIAAGGSTSQHTYGFATINVANGSVIKKLTEIPLDKGSAIGNVIVDGGKAYISANSETGKDYIWEYDVASGTVKPGLEVEGGYDFILRIDKLK
ncbi:DUF4374 domain-containing protein [Dyadobacter sp. CY323]|uniref:DUF4374 domain-containing protein n=1 Tax=Dyadobacter sp. CY323 TaxID=2907302 RepID=UPI001F3D89AF|nr:DUF4374 domain-containing protein [Dyadobacter sp. CY323]MCE6988071.1 DUF4374 domain-containing protein [Dyadobacter sp. CY323]